MERTLRNLLFALDILAGNRLPAQGESMRDVIGTAKTNAAVLAAQLEEAYAGQTEPFMVYPDPAECLETALENEI